MLFENEGRAATSVPVNVNVAMVDLDRLLGERGRWMLNQAVTAIKQLAAEQGWPLRLIDVNYEQSPEELENENIVVVPEINDTALGWDTLFTKVIYRITTIDDLLNETEQEFFHERIQYGIRLKK